MSPERGPGLRCYECRKWVGESVDPLIPVDRIAAGAECKVDPPRDLRLCRSCGVVTVFIPRADLDLRRRAGIASD